jgi:hypothetical protein
MKINDIEMNELKELFEMTFDSEYFDEKRMMLMVKEFGLEKVKSVLHYFAVNPPRNELKPGQRFNPFGFFWKACNFWIL